MVLLHLINQLGVGICLPVTSMQGMFNGATAFDQPIGGWDVSSVSIWVLCFVGSFNQPNDWNYNVTNMNEMFWNMSSVSALINRSGHGIFLQIPKWRKFLMEPSLSPCQPQEDPCRFLVNPNWTYDWATFYRPIPQVKSVQASDDLNYTFNGKVLANGGMPVTMVAFELADNMLFRNAQTHPANLVDE